MITEAKELEAYLIKNTRRSVSVTKTKRGFIITGSAINVLFAVTQSQNDFGLIMLEELGTFDDETVSCLVVPMEQFIKRDDQIKEHIIEDCDDCPMSYIAIGDSYAKCHHWHGLGVDLDNTNDDGVPYDCPLRKYPYSIRLK